MNICIKKMLSAIMVFIMITTMLFAIPVSAAYTTDGTDFAKAGDMNNDNSVDIRDLVVLKKAVTNLNYSDSMVFDINKDDRVDSNDIVIMVKIVLGIDNTLWSVAY